MTRKPEDAQLARSPDSGTTPPPGSPDPDGARPPPVPDGAPPDAPPPLGARLTSRRTILSFLFAFALLAFVLQRQGTETLAASWAQIRGADPTLYLLALLAYYMAFPIRAARWRLLLENSGEPRDKLPSLPPMAVIIYLSWFANSLVPAKLGDLYRGYLLRERSRTSWSHAMGTIVAERVLDMVVLVVLMVTTGALAYGGMLRHAAASGWLACFRSGLRADTLECALLELFEVGGAIALALVVALLAFARFGNRFARYLPSRFAGIYDRFSAGLVLSFGRFPTLLALSVLAWLAEGSAFWLVGRALDQALPLSLVVFFALLQAFITVIPVTPGGLGFEVLLVGALSLRGFPPDSAWAMTGLYRSISYLSLLAGGTVVYLWLQSRRRRA